MAITYTAKGSVVGNDTASMTLAGVTLATGDTLLVGIGWYESLGEVTINSITWGSENLIGEVDNAGIPLAAQIWRLSSPTAGTHNLLVTFSAEVLAASLLAVAVSGLIAAPFDAQAIGNGTGTTPDSGNTPTLAQATEFVWGFIAVAEPPSNPAGTWGDGFTAGQRAGVDGPDANVTASEGYRIPNSTAARHATKSGLTANDWNALCGTYKGAAGVTTEVGTPDSRLAPVGPNQVIVANAPDSRLGPVAAHQITVSATPDSQLGPVSIRQTSILGSAGAMAAAADAVRGGADERGIADNLPDSYDPTAITVLVQTLVPTNPTQLGDLSDATHSQHFIDPTPATGTAEVLATAISDPIPTGGAITHVIFRCVAGHQDTHASLLNTSNITNSRMAWKVGATEDSAAVNTPIIERRTVWPSEGDEPMLADFTRETAPITTRPGGGAWTFDDLVGLHDVAVRIDFNGAAGLYLELVVSEIRIDVYGAIGSLPPGREIRTRQTVPNLAPTLPAGAVKATLPSRTPTTKLKTQKPPRFP